MKPFAAMQISAPAQTLPGLDPSRHALHDRRFSMSYEVMTTCKHPIHLSSVPMLRPLIHAFNRHLYSSLRKTQPPTLLPFVGQSGKTTGMKQ